MYHIGMLLIVAGLIMIALDVIIKRDDKAPNIGGAVGKMLLLGTAFMFLGSNVVVSYLSIIILTGLVTYSLAKSQKSE